MKILHVTPLYEPAWKAGGVVRFTSLLCRGLAELGHDVTVFTTNSDGYGYLEVPVNVATDVGRVEVYYFHTNSPRFIRYSRQLRLACKEMIVKYDIVHITSFWNYPGLPAAKEAIKRNIPYVVSTSGTFVPTALNSKKIRKWIYLKLFDEKILKNASAYRYTTPLERKKMKTFKIQKPSFLAPSGLALKEFDNLPSQTEGRRMLGIEQDYFVVSFLGRLNWVKAIDVLMKGFKKIHRDFPKAMLVLAGPDGGEEKELRELAVKLNIVDKVIFLGPVNKDGRLKLFAASDLLALVSWTESFGYAAVEAMAAGVPVLVSENVGICDAVREDGAGLVVPVDEDAIANALSEMLSNPNRLKDMGKAAYKSARKRYDIKIVAKLMATAYEDILTGRRSPECNWEG
ncbi:MAG TPA: glycosyltransferase [Candidatus Desulfofervidus auxilii]|uniref:Glycosyltransferase n=1 Tax=Desulfofervidus auxilii TaxID=1621989 RepID=A0A7V1I4Q8_DESA2|nr:glycosyltransferase [Candidatus Desulfofervidus auxilii]